MMCQHLEIFAFKIVDDSSQYQYDSSNFGSFHFLFNRFALVGQWTEALSLCEIIEQYLSRMTSLNQLGLIIHALSITYSILCMHDRAHHIFSILTNCESKTSAFSVLRDINSFYQECYTRKAEKYSSDMEKERIMKVALVKDRELLRLRLIRAALDQEMNLNLDRSLSRSMSLSMSGSSKDGYESNDGRNDHEVKEDNTPTASQSFSAVITTII